MYKPWGKRVFDLITVVLGSIFLLPIFVLTLLLLLVEHRGKPFFFQKRPGFKGHFFTMVKFKTMRDTSDQHDNPLPDHQRTTALGKIIRKTSIDELPQLWNVLKGEMSIIGPRPLLIEYLPLYSPDHQRRHDVLPGITGWAQTHGRNAISWEQKFDLDLWYTENLTFILDLKILLLTIRQVVSLKEVNFPNPTATEKFHG